MAVQAHYQQPTRSVVDCSAAVNSNRPASLTVKCLLARLSVFGVRKRGHIEATNLTEGTHSLRKVRTHCACNMSKHHHQLRCHKEGLL